MRDLNEVVASGMCAGCGLCESLAGPDRITMRIAPSGQARPLVKGKLGSELTKRILAVCPGVSVTGPTCGSSKIDPVWGPIKSLHRSHATDESIRFRAAAGGSLTALGCFLLRAKKVDAILHVKASDGNPMLSDCQVSRTESEVVAASQSRYGPSPALAKLHQLIEEGSRVAVIAKPCDIAAVRNLARVDPRVERQVVYCLTLFCGGISNVQTAEKIAAFHGHAPQDVKIFRWRGFGWPGHTHIETVDGRHTKLSYEETWHDPSVPWTNDVQFRCKICPDAIGELADVSCPDGWVIENGKPIYREAPGVNLAIARTERGRKLLQEAQVAGALTLSACDLSELDLIHAGHMRKKLQTPGRMLALWLMGQSRLQVRRYRLLALFRRAGIVMTLRELYATMIRVQKGRNRESL